MTGNITKITRPTIPEGLILWNKLGSTSEAIYSEVGPNGSITGSPTYVSSKHGNGIKIDANSEYVDFDGIFTDDFITTKGTFEFWWQPLFNSSDTTDRQLIANGASGVRIYMDWGYSGSSIRLWHRGLVGSTIMSASPTFSANDKLHIAVCWDSNTITGSAHLARLYVNNVLASSATTLNSTIDGTASVMRVGNIYENFQYANAIFDNIKVWDYAKTDFSDKDIEGYEGVEYGNSSLNNISSEVISISKYGEYIQI